MLKTKLAGKRNVVSKKFLKVVASACIMMMMMIMMMMIIIIIIILCTNNNNNSFVIAQTRFVLHFLVPATSTCFNVYPTLDLKAKTARMSYCTFALQVCYIYNI
jgi:hypothetical protein